MLVEEIAFQQEGCRLESSKIYHVECGVVLKTDVNKDGRRRIIIPDPLQARRKLSASTMRLIQTPFWQATNITFHFEALFLTHNRPLTHIYKIRQAIVELPPSRWF